MCLHAEPESPVKKIGSEPARFEKLPRSTQLQQRAFDLLGLKLVA